MKLTVFGAARTVTGSMHLIEHQGHKLLLDHATQTVFDLLVAHEGIENARRGGSSKSGHG